MKRLGVAGLGLIGGSFVKAYGEDPGWDVIAANRSRKITDIALLAGDIAEEMTEENIGGCDLILLCMYPGASIDYLRGMAPHISRDCLVMDCCGVKRGICEPCFEIADEYGFTFVGGHPMAGRHVSGYKHSKEDLYEDAPMVIVPERFDDIELLARVKELLAPAGFGSISVTTAEEHDRLIAFTSQLAHVVSSAYMKSPTAERHKGFSAGSYKDLTRVAWLNEDMWTELFLDNRDNLSNELGHIIKALSDYKESIDNNDADTLRELLREGRLLKEKVDGNVK